MYFNTLSFIFFFGTAFSLYYLLPSGFRVNVLLVFSLIFFLSNSLLFIFVISFLVLLDYFTVLFFNKNQSHRKAVLVFSVSVNLLLLLLFKYINFLFASLNSVGINIYFNIPPALYEVFIPLGFSFFVFKSISLLVESFRDTLKKEITLRDLFLYFMFFPSVLSGPIDRPGALLKQFGNISNDFSNNIKTGLSFILLGYIKKSVIADRLSFFVDLTYGNIENSSWLQILIAAVFYTFQIYLDFSGYSDMALGFARMFGINIMQNFEKPYFAKSIQDFWRRWHISLSTWLRDYLFLPLAYSSTRLMYRFRLTPKTIEKFSYVYSILITMFLAGLWHGANITFILWGLIMGVYIVTSFLTKKHRSRFKKITGLNRHKSFVSVFQSAFLFLIVAFAWIFFRAESASEAFKIAGRLLFPDFGESNTFLLNSGKVSQMFSIYYPMILIVFIIIAEKYDLRERILLAFKNQAAVFRYAFIIIIILFILFAGNFSTSQFIYFRF
ncbi:MAG: hypothetical protein MUE56_07275 [Ignavibacteria bacterium]|nr:hypothetical protein [Ignavibacteria bacterium]